MSISSIQNGFFQTQSVANMESQLSNLETELGTGEVSQNYAGIGDGRGLAISLQSQLSSIGNYGSVINAVNVRLSSAQQALTQIATSSNLVQSSVANSPFTLDQTGQTAGQETANGQLQQVIDALNTQVGNDYIFSGTATNTPAVAPLSEILNGNGAQAGLNQVISERAQADLGANGLGRLVIPATGAAAVTGTGAALTPDAVAAVSGSQDISGLSSAGGTLVVNGTSITINPGDNAAAIEGDINAQTATIGVTASLDSGNHLVLTSANAATAITVGNTSSASVLGELGLSATTTNPTNLLTQGAVTTPQTLTIQVGANPALTVTFGSGAGQVSTLQGLDQALYSLGGGSASVDPATGNISITALNNTDSITVGGTATLANFGIAAGTTPPTAGTSVSLSEDYAGSPFGLKIASVSSTLTGATVTGPGGSPPGVTVNLATNPNAGDTLTYTFNLPDGTTQQVALTATTASPPAAGQFTIGATPAATATNLQAALTSSVSTLASTSLTAASAVVAGNEFFNADAANPPLRVNGPPFSTATSLVAGTGANTVSWYTGDAASTPVLGTATAQIDPSLSVSFGMRANESALRTSVENLAVFSAMTFSASDPNASARYAALTQRVYSNLNIPSGSQSIPDIEADIAGVQTTMQTTTANQTQATATLTDMVQSIEGANPDTVGSQILSLQTSLQASLQVTALLAHTNLVSLLAPLG
jgi:flagellar hook-associated protein 3 FlgL